MMNKINRDSEDLIGLKKIFQIANVSMSALIAPILFSACAAFFEGISILFLVPLAEAIVKFDFNLLSQSAVIKEWLPRLGINILASNLSRPGQTFFILFLLFIAFSVVLKNFFQYFSGFIFDKHIIRFTHQLRRSLFHQYLSYGKLFFDQNGIGKLQQTILIFTRQIMTALRSLNALLISIFMLVIYFLIMLFISWQLTALSLVLFPIVGFSVTGLIRRIRKNSSGMMRRQTELSHQVSNIIMGIPLVKAYSRENEEEKHFSHLSSSVADSETSIAKKQRLVPVLQEIIGLFSFLGLLALATYVSIKIERQEVGHLLIFFLVLRRSMQHVGSLGRLKALLAEAGAPINQIINFMEKQPRFTVKEGSQIFSGLKREIDFSNIYFSYDTQRFVLNGLNLKIEKGMSTAIIGKTGSGKSTLIHLLLRLYDCPPGALFIDGKDIRDYTLSSLHQHMALVSQDVVLFNDTIRNNILYGIERVVTDRELEEILKKSRLWEFIKSLPKGLETQIGDRGTQLSGGERQRVALARAVLRNAEILFLDEATSALDSKTETLIQEAIDEVIKNKTAIIIAHRLSTIRKANKVVILDEGKIIEEGSPSELLSKKQQFYHFWSEQNPHFS